MHSIIQLSDHFTIRKMLKFTLPTIGMMIFTSIYSVIDGFFISNFAGKTEFAAINMIFPPIMIISSAGFMLGTGGTVLVAKTLGEGDSERANRIFSLLVYFSLAAGAVLSIVGFILLPCAARLIGTDEHLLPYCLLYGRIVLLSMPFFLLQYEFQSYCITAEKPRLGFAITLAAGITNIVLDALLVGVLRLGLAGAAAATSLSVTVGGLIPLLYFSRRNSSRLKLGRTRLEWKYIANASFNGSSELMSNISSAFIGMLYNYQLLKYIGEDGVAAYGVIMYINFIFIAIFIGFAMGMSPVVGFHYGAENSAELKSILKKSLIVITAISILMTCLSYAFAQTLAAIFTGYDENLYRLTYHAVRICSLSFLLVGYNIFGSSFFTGLNNGLVSAAISFLKTLVFQTVAVVVLPFVFGFEGIWFSVVAVEIAAIIVTEFFFITNRKRYNYF